MPVTNVERQLKDGNSVVSKTNLKGIITYVNRTFVEISGFEEDELLGSPQNIVRHPDMPPEAYEDLWATLKAGKAWKGMVKNRCKDGAYYWVEANANPIFDNGRPVGYMSLRTKPTPEQIRRAEEVYRKIREGKARGITIKEGRILPSGVLGLWDKLRKPTVKMRMTGIIGVLLALIIGISSVGLLGLNQTNDSLRTVYEDRMIPVSKLKDIVQLTLRNRIAIMVAADNNNPVEVRNAVANIENNILAIDKLWEAYMGTYLAPEEKILADKFVEARKAFVGQGLKVGIEKVAAGDMQAVKAHIDNVVNPLYKPVAETSAELVALQMDIAKNEYKNAEDRYQTIRMESITAILLGGGLALFLGFMLIRSVVRPLKDVENISMSISSGNLTSDIHVDTDDEIGRVLQAIKNINGNLRGIVNDVRLGSDNISRTSGSIAEGNNDLSQRTQEQASALEETASSMEEMTSTVKQNAENAHQANQLTAGTREQAEKGGVVVGNAVSAMSEINVASKKIADITSVINEIAFQTNLLALNAAVEAARAGDQGRGFAVVAAEVRSLAQRCATAAKEIAVLINDTVEKVDVGSKLVDESGQTLVTIVESVTKASGIVAEIAAASQEQSTGIEQVNKALMQMDDVTQQNASLVEEAAAASKSMEDQAERLVELMRFFKMGSEDALVAQKVRSSSSSSSPSPQRRAPASVGQSTRPAPRLETRQKAKASGGGYSHDSEDWEEF
ncbi:MAG: methyl-accepting chemotaxis protein [Gammaproteobacteria bacterium]|nr:methyl-accepting chemotaxis protein [Gammaproteobacteria bacterium]